MTQSPVTVTYSLETILEQITQKLDRLDQKIDEKFLILQKEITAVQVSQTRLEGEVKNLETQIQAVSQNLETQIQGVSKRLDTQEFINRSVVVGFVLALVAGIIKLFLPS